LLPPRGEVGRKEGEPRGKAIEKTTGAVIESYLAIVVTLHGDILPVWGRIGAERVEGPAMQHRRLLYSQRGQAYQPKPRNVTFSK
jgi:hypothetical protein